MQIKKYEAMDMKEALRMVKSDLGSEAVILSSRKVKRGGGAFGILGRPMVEITAAIDYLIPASPQRESVSREPKKKAALPVEMFVREDIQRLRDEIQGLLKNYTAQTPSDLAQIKNEISGLRQSLEDLTRPEPSREPFNDPNLSMPIPQERTEIYKRYIHRGVDEDLALRMADILCRQKNGDGTVSSPPLEQIAYEMILLQTRVTGPVYRNENERRAVILMGPTGAGKTTTLAKIAARYALGSPQKKVVLITLDTYRIAAVEQLKIYAKIIGVPAEVALSPADLYAIFRRHPEADLFLIDTAGRNQKDQTYLSELSEYFDSGDSGAEEGSSALEGHLVLPATLRSDVLLDVIRRFRVLPIRGLVFTKLDEVEKHGQIFSAMIRGQKPISYFTMGQRVPEDIELATPERMARLVMDGSGPLDRKDA